MKKKQNKKGFTLAELLIVVAIIGVLVAIAIPVFSGKLDKAKQATDDANIRSAYAQYVSTMMTAGKEPVENDKSKGPENAFKAIGVEKLEYYSKVDVKKLPWKGSKTDGKGANSVTFETAA